MNHRMVGVGRDLCGSSSSTLLTGSWKKGKSKYFRYKIHRKFRSESCQQEANIPHPVKSWLSCAFSCNECFSSVKCQCI